jgi:hypothetical protein
MSSYIVRLKYPKSLSNYHYYHCKDCCGCSAPTGMSGKSFETFSGRKIPNFNCIILTATAHASVRQLNHKINSTCMSSNCFLTITSGGVACHMLIVLSLLPLQSLPNACNCAPVPILWMLLEKYRSKSVFYGQVLLWSIYILVIIVVSTVVES